MGGKFGPGNRILSGKEGLFSTARYLDIEEGKIYR